MEEYDGHQINIAIQLDVYEQECRQQTGELGPSIKKTPSPTTSDQTAPVNEDEGDMNEEVKVEEKLKSTHMTKEEQHMTDDEELTLFNVLNEEVRDDDVVDEPEDYDED